MARKDNKIDQLARVRLFSACSKKELTILSRASDEAALPAGHLICEEGKTGHEFFLILDGEVTVKRKGRKVASLGKGSHFGELALLHRGPRNASVVAETPVTVLVLGQREFSGVLDEIPGLAHKMLTAMAARLAELDAKDLSQ